MNLNAIHKYTSIFFISTHLNCEFNIFFFELKTRFKERGIDRILKEANKDLEVFYKSNNTRTIVLF